MALDDILQKIKKETEKKIEEIKEKNQQEIKKIEERYQKEIQKRKEQILDLAQKEGKKRIESRRIQLVLETKNLLLKKKGEILDEIYKEILEKLSKLNDQDYFKLIFNLIKNCSREGEIISAKDREKITQKAILESGRKYILAKKSLPIKGGFIFSTPHLEIDYSFENLIKIIREKTEIEVAKILFS